MLLSLTQGIHRALRGKPEGLACVFKHRRHSYLQFSRRIAGIAAALKNLGVEPGDIVPILSLNSDRYLEYLYAVPWAGAVVCPLNYRWSEAELQWAVGECASRVLFVGDGFESVAENLRREHRLEHLVYVGEGPTPQGMLGYEALAAAAPVDDARRNGDDLYGVFYTGGTTGTPKGVMLTHAGICTAAAAVMAEGDIPPGTTYLRSLPMFHVGDGAWSIAALWRMGTHVILDKFDVEAWLSAVDREQVTSSGTVPTVLQAICDHPDLAGYQLGSLKHILYGGAPMAPAAMIAATQVFPGVQFSQGYGMTEYASMMTHLHPQFHDQHNPRLKSAGRANIFTELRIRLADGTDAPPGTPGEIQVRGPQVMKGYLKRDDLSAAAIVDGWLCTGDVGYLDEEGFLFIVDRIKDMIVTGGENVYSAEVESALARHPAVARVAVIGIPHARWGESVHAAVVLRTGMSAREEDLRSHCASLIGGFKCPRSFEFRDELPLTSFGKVAKTELRHPFWAAAGRAVG